MSMPRGLVHTQYHTFDKEEKKDEHIVRVSDKEFEHGDPNFVDERVPAHKLKKEEKSFLSALFENED